MFIAAYLELQALHAEMATKMSAMSVADFMELYELKTGTATKVSAMSIATFLELQGLKPDVVAKVSPMLAEDHEIVFAEHLALLSEDQVLEACQVLNLKTVSKEKFNKAVKAAQVLSLILPPYLLFG